MWDHELMTFALSLLIAFLSLASAPVVAQESKGIPKDSVEIEARGCLKGRVFTATVAPEDEGTRRGPDVVGRHFRLSGKREVMDEVKKFDGHRVAIVGIVRKSALDDQGMGMKVGGARVVIGAQGADPNSRVNSRMTAPAVPVMDVTAVRDLSERCYTSQ
jgi:hypothetical protein